MVKLKRCNEISDYDSWVKYDSNPYWNEDWREDDEDSDDSEALVEATHTSSAHFYDSYVDYTDSIDLEYNNGEKDNRSESVKIKYVDLLPEIKVLNKKKLQDWISRISKGEEEGLLEDNKGSFDYIICSFFKGIVKRGVITNEYKYSWYNDTSSTWFHDVGWTKADTFDKNKAADIFLVDIMDPVFDKLKIDFSNLTFDDFCYYIEFGQGNFHNPEVTIVSEATQEDLDYIERMS
jgi:hypothetical protein